MAERKDVVNLLETKKEPIDEKQLVQPGIYHPNKNKFTTSKKCCRIHSRRFVFKNGEINIDRPKFFKRSFFTKWFITMIEARWRWNLLHFVMAFISEWLFFAFVYWIIALIHGDLTEDHLPYSVNATDWVPCVNNIYGFTSTFLFSVEVHTTVAYGKRSITLECPGTIMAMCFQCIVSHFFQAIMIGILFAKLTRPKSRTQTILFSKQAVITLRDGLLCMIFRVGDMRKSRILNIKASAFILKVDIGDEENFVQTELKVEIEGCESTFFLWPVSIIHTIDKRSPLYGVSAADLLFSNIEILAVFEGIIESTGQPVQARTSYKSYDIMWGHRFMPMVDNHSETKYDVDYSKLCQTTTFNMPLCSASEFNSMMTLYK